MASRVPLPRQSELPELILFHRDHPGEPTIVLQVPNADRTDSETYLLDLDFAEHAAWFDGLPHARALRDLLGMEMHVAYCPRTGHQQQIADIDEPSFGAQLVGGMRQAVSGPSPFFERHFARRSLTVPPISHLRSSLGSKLR